MEARSGQERRETISTMVSYARLEKEAMVSE